MLSTRRRYGNPKIEKETGNELEFDANHELLWADLVKLGTSPGGKRPKAAHLQSSVFKLSKDLIDSIHEEGIVAYTS